MQVLRPASDDVSALDHDGPGLAAFRKFLDSIPQPMLSLSVVEGLAEVVTGDVPLGSSC